MPKSTLVSFHEEIGTVCILSATLTAMCVRQLNLGWPKSSLILFLLFPLRCLFPRVFHTTVMESITQRCLLHAVRCFRRAMKRAVFIHGRALTRWLYSQFLALFFGY